MATVYTNFFGGAFFGGGFFGPGTSSGGGPNGGGSGGGPEPWKVPQWAIDQREERERAYEAEQARKLAGVDLEAPRAIAEVRIPEGGIVTKLAYDGASELAKSIESVYELPRVVPGRLNDEEDAIIALLMSD